MGTAIFMVLMVCGYWYTSRDLSTRFKIKRSFGWDVYFWWRCTAVFSFCRA